MLVGRKKTFSLLPLLILASGIGLQATACEIKLGAVGPLSGPAAQWGQAIKGAADFVAAKANAAGGLDVGKEKCKVTVLAVDSVLDGGRLMAEGSPAEVLRRPEVIDAYPGTSHEGVSTC